jgi:DNA-binding NarL/FixJ family response regulator
MRAGLCRILDDDPDLEVVGEGSTADEAVALAEATRPDVFVMDLSLIGEGGISATQRIRTVSPDTRVVILTMHEDIAYLREAFAAGATGYVLKKGAYQELTLAVRTVAAGQHYVHPSLGSSLMSEDPATAQHKPVPLLSAREAEILRLLVLGYTNAEIGRNVSLSGRTVETYRARIQQKLGLRSRAELVRYARDIGLLE